jgi:hypothetical protein
MTYMDLQNRLHDQRFRPFRVKLVNNTTYDVLEPWMIMVGESSAIVATQTKRDDRGYRLAMEWRTVSISHMIEFQDLPPEQEAKRKRA